MCCRPFVSEAGALNWGFLGERDRAGAPQMLILPATRGLWSGVVRFIRHGFAVRKLFFDVRMYTIWRTNCVRSHAPPRQLNQPFSQRLRGVLPFRLGDVRPVVTALPALHHIGGLTHHVRQRRYCVRCAAHHVKPCRLFGFVAPPLLRRGQCPSAPLVALSRLRQSSCIPKR